MASAKAASDRGLAVSAQLVLPRDITGPQIASHVGYEYSGGFRNALSTLRTAGLITGTSNTAQIAVAPELLA